MPEETFSFVSAKDANTVALIRSRITVNGPSGSGKTFTALKVATALAKLYEPVIGRRPKIWLIDTERESALLYRREFDFEHMSFPPPHSVKRYIAAFDYLLTQAKDGDMFILDSGTHAWAGPGGILERVDTESRKFGGNKWSAWSILTPEQNKFFDRILSMPLHIFMTTRTKTEWVEEEKNGKKVPKRVGLAPIQREGIEYEFTVELIMDERHTGRIGKTRIKEIADQEFETPGLNLATNVFNFLITGTATPTPEDLKAGMERYGKDPTTPKASETPVQKESVVGATEKEPTPVHVGPSQTEHERLAKVLTDAIEAKDSVALRGFPALVGKASKDRTLDRQGYDDLVASYQSWKKGSKP